jgi:hypothetical protein
MIMTETVNNEPAKLKVLNSVAPHITLPKGAAWIPELEVSKRVLANWYLYSPESEHTALFLTMHHLRTIEGEEGPDKTFPLATHCLLILAMEQSQTLYINKLPIFQEKEVWHSQWYCSKDEDAVKQINNAVEAVCKGYIDPCGDEKDFWILNFGTNTNTSKKFKTSYIITSEQIN